MSLTVNKSVNAGVALVVGLILASVGVGVLDSSTFTQEFEVDNNTEWTNYGSSLSGVQVNGSYLVLEDANTSGTYTSVTLDSNESDSSRYEVLTNVPDADNSSVTLTVSGNDYTLEDGFNTVDLDSKGDSFELTLERDATSVSSPEVDYVRGLSGETGSILRLVGLASFGLLLLLGLLQYMDVGFSRGGRP